MLAAAPALAGAGESLTKTPNGPAVVGPRARGEKAHEQGENEENSET